MKSRMKCFSFLALIAFGFGYSDLLVRPSLAHANPDPYADPYDYHSHTGSIPIDGLIHAAVSFYEWLDSGGDADDYDSSSGSSDPWDTVSYPNLPSSNSGSLEPVFQSQEATNSPAETIIENDICTSCPIGPHSRSHPCNDRNDGK